MITPSFGLTATERVLPKLALDFTTASLDNRITFTRALNTATRVNSSGYIETVSSDLPRFDYNPITLVCKGLLIEESRGNIFQYSEDFNQATWTRAEVTVLTAQSTSPANTNTANTIVETAVNADHGVYDDFNATNATPYTISVFAKKKDRDFIFFSFYGNKGVFNGNRVWFNISTGTIATVQAGITATITAYRDGWYRCTATQTAAATAQGYIGIFQSTADAEITYLGDTAKGTYLWGAQLEAGAFPTSYIPTTTTSLTRNADVATMTGTNFSSWFNASEGSFEIDAAFNNMVATNSYMFNVDDGTVNNRYSFWRWTGNSKLFCTVITSSSNVAQVEKAAAIVANTYYNSTLGYKENDFGASFSGVATQTDTSLTLPTVNTLRFSGQDSSNTNPFNGWWRKLLYWPQKLTSAELQAFSK